MKTLKDIKFTTIPQYLQRRMIRKEAIKWIKELDLGNKKSKTFKLEGWEFEEDEYCTRELTSIQIFIKHFFNITEDDLK